MSANPITATLLGLAIITIALAIGYGIGYLVDTKLIPQEDRPLSFAFRLLAGTGLLILGLAIITILGLTANAIGNTILEAAVPQ